MTTKMRTIRHNPTYYWAHYSDPDLKVKINDGSTGLLTTYSCGVQTSPDTMPGYKSLIRRGVSATTALSGRDFSILASNYFRLIVTGLTSGVVKSSYAVGMLPLAPPDSVSLVSQSMQDSAEASAIAAVVRQIKQVNRKFQGGTFLGELGETVRMLKNPARALQEGVGDYLSTLRKRAKNRPDTAARKRILADTWLEYSFGWVPLLHDIDDGVKAVTATLRDEKRPRLQRVFGKGKQSSSTSESGSVISNGPLNVGVVTTYTAEADVRYYGMVRCFNPSSDAFRHYGVSLNDFAPTAWELVPWSFFVDYFANIGDIIDAATLNFADVAWLNRAYKGSIKTSYITSVFGDWKLNSEYHGGQGAYLVKEVSRTPVFGRLVPPLAFKLPGSGTKLANIAALLPQMKKMLPFY